MAYFHKSKVKVKSQHKQRYFPHIIFYKGIFFCNIKNRICLIINTLYYYLLTKIFQNYVTKNTLSPCLELCK